MPLPLPELSWVACCSHPWRTCPNSKSNGIGPSAHTERSEYTKRVTFLLLAIIASAPLLGACDRAEPTKQIAAPPPPAVIVTSVAEQEVTPSTSFNGRIEAVDTVELRARVQGFVEKRLFEEGAEVKAGDLLIVLEKAPYEAQIGQVKGQITSADGALRLAKLEVDRSATLVQRQAAAQARLDEANAKYAQALGELQQLQASLKRSELDLSYTEIRAPMDGRIGRFRVSVGDFVTASSEPLAEIVSQDPMYVTFPVSARTLLEMRKKAEATGGNSQSLRVKLRLPDGSVYGEAGTINFVDVQVSSTTDTVTVRASIPNTPDSRSQRILIHNQLVTAIIEHADPEQALVIPQAAVAIDQAGPYVLVVDKEGKAEQRRVRLGSGHGSEISVAEGLKAGERVIVEGLQKVRPGQAVAASAPSKSGN